MTANEHAAITCILTLLAGLAFGAWVTRRAQRKDQARREARRDRHQRAEARRAGADALIIAIATQARVDFETERADLAAWENELADGWQR